MTVVAICLYLIGILMVLSIFEVAEDASPLGLFILCVFWPLITIRMVLEDMLSKPEE